MRTRPAAGGFTAAELIITVTMLSVAVLAVIPLFKTGARETTPLEAETLLAAGTQRAAADIYGRLSGASRLFGDDAAGRSFLARIAPALARPALPGTRLPAIKPDAAPAASSAAADAGNSLLFAGAGPPADLPDVLNGLGRAAAVRLKTHVFNYYYLAADPDRTIGGLPARGLWAWRSVPYVDYQELVGLADATQQHNAIAALATAGIHFAFNPGAADAATAFYRISETFPWIAPDPAHAPAASPSGGALLPPADAPAGGLACSISPNTGGAFTHRFPVPAYGEASGDFPSGFEALVAGPAGNRRVLARIVAAAEGKFKGLLACEKTISVAARDARATAPGTEAKGPSR